MTIKKILLFTAPLFILSLCSATYTHAQSDYQSIFQVQTIGNFTQGTQTICSPMGGYGAISPLCRTGSLLFNQSYYSDTSRTYTKQNTISNTRRYDDRSQYDNNNTEYHQEEYVTYDPDDTYQDADQDNDQDSGSNEYDTDNNQSNTQNNGSKNDSKNDSSKGSKSNTW